jgi:hypothetical protein
MRYSLTIAAFSLGFFFRLEGQTVLHTSDTSSGNNKVSVNVLNPHGKQPVTYNGNSMHTDSVQQALKINFFQVPRGEYSLYYEYRLADAFSVEAGAGVTYIDYFYEMFENEGRFFGNSHEARSVRFLSGFAAHLQFRCYPSKYETAITGFYVAADASRRDWQMDYNVNTGLINEPHRIKRTWNDFKIQIGFQDADPYENIFWEWYLAAGLRLFDGDYIKGVGVDAQFLHEKYWLPVFAGGLKLGFTL